MEYLLEKVKKQLVNKNTFFCTLLLIVYFLNSSFQTKVMCLEDRFFPVEINTSRFKCVNTLAKNSDFISGNSRVYSEWKKYKSDSLLITSIYYDFKQNDCLRGFNKNRVSFTFCNDKLFETQHTIDFSPEHHKIALEQYNSLIKKFKLLYKYYQVYDTRFVDTNEDTGELYEFSLHDLKSSINPEPDIRVDIEFQTYYSTYHNETKISLHRIFLRKENSSCKYYSSD